MMLSGEIAAEDVKTVNQWERGNELPALHLEWSMAEDLPLRAEQELYARIAAAGEDRLALCREFLRDYPDSGMRAAVFQQIAILLKKDLKIYPLESQYILPHTSATMLLLGQGMAEVELQIRKIDLLEALERGFFACFSAAQCCNSWRETDIKTPHFQREVRIPPLSPGLYGVSARSGDLEDTAFVAVTDLAMVVTRDRETALAWIGSFTGTPGPLKLYLFQGRRRLASSTTNPSGIWAARVPGDFSPLTFAAVHEDGHIAVAESSWYRYEQELRRCYLHLDRSCYLPGEIVRAKIFSREWDPETAGYRCKPNENIQVSIQDERWNCLLSRTMVTTPAGTAGFCWAIPPSATAGMYTLRVRGRSTGEARFVVGSFSEVKSGMAHNPGNAPIILFPRRSYSVGEKALISTLSAEPDDRPVLLTCEGDKLFGYSLQPEAWPEQPGYWPKQVGPEMSPSVRVTATRFNRGVVERAERDFAVVNPENRLCVELRAEEREEAGKRRLHLKVSATDHRQAPATPELLIWVMPEPFFHGQNLDSSDVYQFYYPPRARTALPSCDSSQFEFPHCREYQYLTARKAAPPVLPETVSVAPTCAWHCPYWEPHRQCDSGGQSEFDFALPWGSQSWRISVVAIDEKTRIGQAYLVVSP